MFTLRNVEVTLNGKTILQDIDLHLPEGVRAAVVGASGSGKTTLLKLLCFMVRHCAGTVEYRGRLVKATEVEKLRRKIPLTHQEPLLWETTVFDNLTLPFTFRSARGVEVPTREQLADYLECVELDPGFLEKPVRNLSGGEKQRVAIARALCLEPEALLLDEPTSALDIVTAEKIFDNILARYPSLTLIAVTHSAALIARTDRQILLRQGRLHSVEEGLTASRLKKFLGAEK